MRARTPGRTGLGDDLIANVVYTGSGDKPKLKALRWDVPDRSAEQSSFGGLFHAEVPWKPGAPTKDKSIFPRRCFHDRQRPVTFSAIPIRHFQEDCYRYA